MKPTPGRIVHYTLNQIDADLINSRRAKSDGAQVGNSAAAGQTYPAMVVRVFDGNEAYANLQVFLDGNDSLWSTSRGEGELGTPGTWAWPPRV